MINIDLKKYPEELIKGRDSAEATFVFCLWKQPDLYDDFQRVNANEDQTLKTDDGVFYFSLGRQMCIRDRGGRCSIKALNLLTM